MLCKSLAIQFVLANSKGKYTLHHFSFLLVSSGDGRFFSHRASYAGNIHVTMSSYESLISLVTLVTIQFIWKKNLVYFSHIIFMFISVPVFETKASPSVRYRQLLVRTRNFLHISLQINVWITRNSDQDRQLFQISPEHCSVHEHDTIYTYFYCHFLFLITFICSFLNEYDPYHLLFSKIYYLICSYFGICLITFAASFAYEHDTNCLKMLFSFLLYPPYPKDRGMLWFYVEAARRPQWC